MYTRKKKQNYIFGNKVIRDQIMYDLSLVSMTGGLNIISDDNQSNSTQEYEIRDCFVMEEGD